jgi:hypothetical protein
MNYSLFLRIAAPHPEPKGPITECIATTLKISRGLMNVNVGKYLFSIWICNDVLTMG